MELKQGLVIFKGITGSKLYGTDTPDSDEDYTGVFMPNLDILFGLESCDSVDESLISKDSSGKNTAEAVDMIYHNYYKFVKLAMDNNPNILEILFTPSSKILHVDKYGFGKTLLKNRHLFPYRGLIGKFVAYSRAQKHKMTIKTDSFTLLETVLDFLSNTTEILLQQVVPELCSIGCKADKNNLYISDLTFPLGVTVKKVRQSIERRLKTFSSRGALISRYGFDCKFGSHLIRLLLEAKELLSTGDLEFPLKERGLILDIKQGKYSLEQVLTMSENLEKDIDSVKAVIPEKKRYKEINKLLIDTSIKWVYKLKEDNYG